MRFHYGRAGQHVRNYYCPTYGTIIVQPVANYAEALKTAKDYWESTRHRTATITVNGAGSEEVNGIYTLDLIDDDSQYVYSKEGSWQDKPATFSMAFSKSEKRWKILVQFQDKEPEELYNANAFPLGKIKFPPIFCWWSTSAANDPTPSLSYDPLPADDWPDSEGDY